ncbi:hypothetical protein [Halococcus salsus]|uniref:hypothetical protein n=1 Tax=Halococcus salsus TaxID=2162894 RepID=UPI001F04F2EC|nr:hypothetical protein [Halococcus salsus]
MSLPLQIPGMPGGADPLGLAILLVGCALAAWVVYRDASRRGIGYAWQAGVAVGALLFAGLIPGLLALAVYVLVVRR